VSAAVEVHDLVVRYDRVTALDGATVTVATGEALGIVGPNGSGKSTLLKAIAGLVKPAWGSITVFGKSPRALAAGSIAYVPQIEDVDWGFPVCVYDVVSMGRFPRLGMFKRFGREDCDAVDRALDLVGMTGLAKRHISQLSGGQQQRVFVARAIAQSPQLMLLDEPTTGVDAATEESLRCVVRELVKNGLPIIMSTHDLDRAGEWFDRLMVLDRRVLAIGKPDEVLESGAYAGIREHTHTHGHMRVES
jgi:ABC-type Mn2+/Zn2+ transport system ATPase subunit